MFIIPKFNKWKLILYKSINLTIRLNYHYYSNPTRFNSRNFFTEDVEVISIRKMMIMAAMLFVKFQTMRLNEGWSKSLIRSSIPRPVYIYIRISYTRSYNLVEFAYIYNITVYTECMAQWTKCTILTCINL